jgi:hypothetical protein
MLPKGMTQKQFDDLPTTHTIGEYALLVACHSSNLKTAIQFMLNLMEELDLNMKLDKGMF